MENLHVFIVENDALAKALIRDHFGKDEITYASIFNSDMRGEITEALNRIQN